MQEGRASPAPPKLRPWSEVKGVFQECFAAKESNKTYTNTMEYVC